MFGRCPLPNPGHEMHTLSGEGSLRSGSSGYASSFSNFIAGKVVTPQFDSWKGSLGFGMYAISAGCHALDSFLSFSHVSASVGAKRLDTEMSAFRPGPS